MSAETSTATILVVDDEKNIRESLKIALSQAGLRVLLAHDADSAARTLHEEMVDALILDIRLGDVDGLTLFRKLQATGFEAPTIFISGHATLTEAAHAIRAGAFDFLEKPFSAERAVVTVQRCLDHAQLRRRLRVMNELEGAVGLVGDSSLIRAALRDILKVAPTNASVLLQGESGVGKELAANMIHAHSARSAQPFIKVNCSAIPENLVESELFGYERGAFSGAQAPKKGLFELAHRGSIFLDEVADLSLNAQAKILRVLQTGELQKVGAERSIRVDVRVIAATHKNLKERVQDMQFREDLYYRLNVVPIRLPALRERPSDIPVLVHYLLGKLRARNNVKDKPIDDDVVAELKGYRWPGNVRELQNVLERMLIMSGARLTVHDIPEDIYASREKDPATTERSSLQTFRDNAERDFIIATLRRLGGNITRAAAELGVGRTYLHRRLGVLRIGKSDY